MFGIGTQEILVILILAVIIVGPKRLPEVASMLGKSFAEFKKAMDGLKEGMAVDIRTELEKEDILKKYPHLADTETQPAAVKVEEVPFPEDEAAAAARTPGESAGGPPDATAATAAPTAPAGTTATAVPAVEAAPTGEEAPPDLSKLEPSYKPEEIES